ncbi:MAG: hydrogen peroxide-inducible genes activator [Bacteroidales bacterium]|jgi:LysR family hydrogen peroxide-inducible transcriptional activator|nr:hydrogen peroxide-inducible genes activator [Bacteroidales bacterium]
MNIQQLEYVVAVDNFRHFAKAAEVCCVTQPTLSMMIQKFEEEVGAKIFDRSKHPVEPTPTGVHIISQIRISLKHFRQIKELVENEQNMVKGVFRLGIIPTVASYLVPALLQKRHEAGNSIELVLKEVTTSNMINEILTGTLDGGILAGPLYREELAEYPLYYEKFYAYVSPHDEIFKEKEIDINKMDISDIWLLENEHCLRGQIERLCKLKKEKATGTHVKYESGSIETLLHVVDCNPGITIIPEMHAMGLSEDKQDNLRPFKNMTAVREVSVITDKGYVRKTMLNIILDIVRSSVPKSMQDPSLKQYVVEL